MMNLYMAAAAAGLIVVEGDLPEHEPSRYYHSHRCIVLRTGMSRADVRTALGHELGHADHGHLCSYDDEQTAKQERQADEYAARLLITNETYAAAEKEHGSHVGAIAHQLEVLPRLVHVWRDLYQRKGPTSLVPGRCNSLCNAVPVRRTS